MYLRNGHSEFLGPLLFAAFGREEFGDLTKPVSYANWTDLWVVCVLQGWWGPCITAVVLMLAVYRLHFRCKLSG